MLGNEYYLSGEAYSDTLNSSAWLIATGEELVIKSIWSKDCHLRQGVAELLELYH